MTIPDKILHDFTRYEQELFADQQIENIDTLYYSELGRRNNRRIRNKKDSRLKKKRILVNVTFQL